MNKTLLSVALIAGFGIAAFAPQAAHAVDGTINFSGKVVANTCAFNVNGAGSSTGAVTLPVVFTSALTAAGQNAGATPFTIAVTACDLKLTSVQENFTASPNIAADGNLSNTAPANGVEIQLLNGASVINLSTNANSPVGILTAGAVTFNLTARYFTTAASTSGLVTSSATFTTNYL